jgi:NADH dehydrogenase FAD-containing subunit
VTDEAAGGRKGAAVLAGWNGVGDRGDRAGAPRAAARSWGEQGRLRWLADCSVAEALGALGRDGQVPEAWPEGGRVAVSETGEATGFPGVFVVGDCAASPWPPSAQAAERQASRTAAVILGQRPRSVRPAGVVASLGTREGFATFFGGLVGSPARRLKTLVEWLYRWHARP